VTVGQYDSIEDPQLIETLRVLIGMTFEVREKDPRTGAAGQVKEVRRMFDAVLPMVVPRLKTQSPPVATGGRSASLTLSLAIAAQSSFQVRRAKGEREAETHPTRCNGWALSFYRGTTIGNTASNIRRTFLDLAAAPVLGSFSRTSNVMPMSTRRVSTQLWVSSIESY